MPDPVTQFRNAYLRLDGKALHSMFGGGDIYSLDQLQRMCRCIGVDSLGRGLTLRRRITAFLNRTFPMDVADDDEEEEDDFPGAEEFDTNADGISLKEAVELLHNFPDDKVIKALMNYPIIRDNVVGAISERDQYLEMLKEACLALALAEVEIPSVLESFWQQHGGILLERRMAEVDRLKREIARGEQANLQLQKLLNVEVEPEQRVIRRIVLRKRQ